jgi:hypothetical protein
MNSGTLFNALILAIATGIVTYFILYSSMAKMFIKNNNFDVAKAISYSTIISLIFTIVITIISIQVDKYARKK